MLKMRITWLEAMQRYSASCHTWLILFLATNCVHRSSQSQEANKSTTLGKILTGYEEKLRPNDGGPAVHVDLGVEVESLSSISASTMDFSLTMFLRQYWHDPRLISNSTGHIILKGNDVELIWTPDIFFFNEKKAKIHDVTVTNKLVYIQGNGSVWMSLRLSATLACHMSLEHFPMDSQTCSIKMMSYAYDTEEMQLTLDKENVYIDDNIEIPRFHFLGMDVSNGSRQFATATARGDFSICEIKLKFERQMQAYLLTVYIPSVLLVVIAWLSFWIDARAAPARITLGITTVLTVTTMTSGILETLPIVTYAKAIDIWLAACLLFVFLCLLEYAWANYLTVLEANRTRTRKSRKSKKKGDKNGDTTNGSQDNIDAVAATIEMEYLLGKKHLTALQLDKISRIVFPIAFVIFNLIYWPYYLYKGDLILKLKSF